MEETKKSNNCFDTVLKIIILGPLLGSLILWLSLGFEFAGQYLFKLIYSNSFGAKIIDFIALFSPKNEFHSDVVFFFSWETHIMFLFFLALNVAILISYSIFNGMKLILKDHKES